jgi:PIN domain nuclease of toxin-antitoxin system
LNLLLDTHLLLWWLGDDPALSPAATTLIRDAENTIFVSAVSHWEIRLKESVGKLRLPADFEKALAAQSFENLPLKAAHARQIVTLPWHHRDPFDRMLIAQAKAERLRFLTADRTLAAYGDAVQVA